MQVKKMKDRVRLSLEGAVTVNQAAELKKALLEALEKGDRVEIDCEHVSEVDLAFLQLLCSAYRTAVAGKKSLSLVDQEGSALSEAVHRAGFSYHGGSGDGSSDSWLWIGGREQ